MNIVLHIERLVLDGIPVMAADHEVIKAVLAGELSQLLASGGLRPELQSGGARAAIAGGTIELSRGAGADRLGQQLAHAVHAGIGAHTPPVTGPAATGTAR